MFSRRSASRAAAVALMVLTVFASAAQAADTTYGGQATVVQANVLGQQVTLADTGPRTGGAHESSLLSASVPGLLTANVLHASTVGQNDSSRSEASVADLDLTAGSNTVSADFLMSRAEARCGPGGASLSGSSDVARLVVNGQTIAVSGQPNQTVTLPGGGTVVINEQTRSGDSITVNALHVVVPGVADVVVSSSQASIACGSKECASAKDFVTSGGWILTPSGDRGTFGVAGGIKNGAFWGHLTYVDHGARLKVKGTDVTGYTVTGPTSRQIRGTAEANGQPVTYVVDVADNGEPGKQDTFSIRLSNGYSAAGTLQGGNVQLHTACKA